MKTCENAVKNLWNTLWKENTLWKTLWILHSLNFEKISKFRTLWKNLWTKFEKISQETPVKNPVKKPMNNFWENFLRSTCEKPCEKTYEQSLRKLLKKHLWKSLWKYRSVNKTWVESITEICKDPLKKLVNNNACYFIIMWIKHMH